MFFSPVKKTNKFITEARAVHERDISLITRKVLKKCHSLRQDNDGKAIPMFYSL